MATCYIKNEINVRANSCNQDLIIVKATHEDYLECLLVRFHKFKAVKQINNLKLYKILGLKAIICMWLLVILKNEINVRADSSK